MILIVKVFTRLCQEMNVHLKIVYFSNVHQNFKVRMILSRVININSLMLQTLILFMNLMQTIKIIYLSIQKLQSLFAQLTIACLLEIIQNYLAQIENLRWHNATCNIKVILFMNHQNIINKSELILKHKILFFKIISSILIKEITTVKTLCKRVNLENVW